MKNKLISSGNATTLIAYNVEIKGNIKFSGDLEIEGRVIGDIIANSDNENAKLRILQSGSIKGNIQAPHINVNGSVKGDITSSQLIEISGQASITGNVNYINLEVAKGAVINGMLVNGIEKTPHIDKESIKKINQSVS